MGARKVPTKRKDGTPYRGVLTEIHGVQYPSITAAAHALGVSHTTVSRHMDAGTLDQIGKHQYSGGTQPNRYGNEPPQDKEFRYGRWREKANG